MDTPLAREFQTFNALREQLMKEHPGKFVLIKDDKQIGIFENELEAIEKGKEMFDQGSFLVNEIADTNDVAHYRLVA